MKHRILVVEDNLLNRELLCDWLQITCVSKPIDFKCLKDHPHACLFK